MSIELRLTTENSFYENVLLIIEDVLYFWKNLKYVTNYDSILLTGIFILLFMICYHLKLNYNEEVFKNKVGPVVASVVVAEADSPIIIRSPIILDRSKLRMEAALIAEEADISLTKQKKIKKDNKSKFEDTRIRNKPKSKSDNLRSPFILDRSKLRMEAAVIAEEADILLTKQRRAMQINNSLI